MSFFENLANLPPKVLAGIINALNPLRIIAVGLLYFAAVIVIITFALMLPGLFFGLIPEIIGAQFWWAKDAAEAVTNNILPIWFSFLLFIAVFADIALDFFILLANIVGPWIFPPTYTQIGFFSQQTGGWEQIPFNPLNTLINQLYDFFQTIVGD